MEASANLATLPSDIKIVITRMIHRYEDSINARLISPAWNIVINNHLASTKKSISIERVYLHSGTIPIEDYEYYGARHDTDRSKRVQMHAIISDEHLERIGVGKWLSVNEEFPSALELFCSTQKFRVWSAHSAFVALVQRKKKEKRRFGLFERLFSCCTQIDTLVLDHMKDKFLTVFDAMMFKLGAIGISTLEIKEFEVDENMQERILQMVRKHRIQHLAIACCKLEEHSLAEFLTTLMRLGIQFEFYEERFNRRFCGRYRLPYKFWSKLDSNMEKRGLSMVYTSEVVDPGFNNNVMHSEVISRMTCVRGNARAAMEASVTLAALPNDIKIVIARMIHRYVDSINARLISPTWNIVVTGHLASTKKAISIERVYLHSGNVTVEDYEYYGGRHDTDRSKRVQMHAIIRNEHLERVGVGTWLSVHEEFPSALELFCAPQKLRVWSAPSAFVALVQRKKKEKRRFELFERFFSSCAQIDTLVLDHMKDKYLKVFDALISKLGEISIANLEIKEFEVDENMQERILQMVQKHHIQHVAIACCKLEQHSLAEFLVTLDKLGIKMELYEEKFNRVYNEPFRLPRRYWTNLKTNLENQGLFLVWAYENTHPGFNKNAMNSEVISSLTCVRDYGRSGAHFQPSNSRGFFRKLPYLRYS